MIDLNEFIENEKDTFYPHVMFHWNTMGLQLNRIDGGKKDKYPTTS